MNRHIPLVLVLFLFSACGPLTPISPIPSEVTKSPEMRNTAVSPDNQTIGNLKESLLIVRDGKTYEVAIGYKRDMASWEYTQQHFTGNPNSPSTYLPSTAFGDIYDSSVEWIGDLDDDGEIEYVVVVTTVGASCCEVASFIYYDSALDEYLASPETLSRYYGGLLNGIKDIDGDGIPEFITRNESFNLLVMGGAVTTRQMSPLQVYRFEDGKFVDSSLLYQKLVYDDAQQWLKKLDSDEAGRGYYLVLYLADMYEIHKQEEGDRVYLELCAKYKLYPSCQGRLEEWKTKFSEFGL